MSNVPLRLAAGNTKLLVSLYFLDRYLQLACPKSVIKMVILFFKLGSRLCWQGAMLGVFKAYLRLSEISLNGRSKKLFIFCGKHPSRGG